MVSGPKKERIFLIVFSGRWEWGNRTPGNSVKFPNLLAIRIQY
jgi:hypothetical protein